MIALLNIALSQFGVKEIPGQGHNSTILRYFREIGHKWVDNDETAWCSAFVNWLAFKCGFQMSGKLNARSWLEVGEEIIKPELGDVVIFWREDPSSWKGHVALFVNYSEDGKFINCLGGNQGNMVSIKPYPTRRLLGFRRLSKLSQAA